MATLVTALGVAGVALAGALIAGAATWPSRGSVDGGTSGSAWNKRFGYRILLVLVGVPIGLLAVLPSAGVDFVGFLSTVEYPAVVGFSALVLACLPGLVTVTAIHRIRTIDEPLDVSVRIAAGHMGGFAVILFVVALVPLALVDLGHAGLAPFVLLPLSIVWDRLSARFRRWRASWTLSRLAPTAHRAEFVGRLGEEIGIDRDRIHLVETPRLDLPTPWAVGTGRSRHVYVPRQAFDEYYEPALTAAVHSLFQTSRTLSIAAALFRGALLSAIAVLVVTIGPASFRPLLVIGAVLAVVVLVGIVRPALSGYGTHCVFHADDRIAADLGTAALLGALYVNQDHGRPTPGTFEPSIGERIRRLYDEREASSGPTDDTVVETPEPSAG